MRIAHCGPVLEAVCFAVVVEIGLRASTYRWMLALAHHDVNISCARPLTAALAERAARRAYRLLPFERTCLKESLVVCRMLRNRGLPARVCVGARKHQGQFEAHAWVQDETGTALTDPQEHFVPFTL